MAFARFRAAFSDLGGNSSNETVGFRPELQTSVTFMVSIAPELLELCAW
jgi:hypothetical protein